MILFYCYLTGSFPDEKSAVEAYRSIHPTSGFFSVTNGTDALCPICGKKMESHGDEEGILTCPECNLYWGLDEEDVKLGYFTGKWETKKAAISKWNDLVLDKCFGK